MSNMKKTLVTIGIFILATMAAKFLGQHSGTASAIQEAQQEAIAQGMPGELFGVKWLTPLEEVKQLRPNIRQINEEMFSEQETFLGRKANITYFVKNNSTLMFIITFFGSTSREALRQHVSF